MTKKHQSLYYERIERVLFFYTLAGVILGISAGIALGKSGFDVGVNHFVIVGIGIFASIVVAIFGYEQIPDHETVERLIEGVDS